MKDFFQKIQLYITQNYALFFLVLISIYLCYRNYTPNTYLTGWDTLHPEFNYRIYWSRILDAVWQGHQGLGAVGSQAHASEIPRILILMLLNIFFATNQIRYLYAFLMLIIGPIGVYFFLKNLFLSDLSPKSRELGSFCGGLFYLLNLATLQQFNVPLEMFLTHYGFLGWVLLASSKYFDTGRRKYLLFFLILSILIAPQAHTATLFYAYFLMFILYFVAVLVFEILSKSVHIKSLIRRLLTLIILTLAVNSFWLLPNIYFVIMHGAEVQQSSINQLFSEEAFLANKQYGTIKDISILKNFLFSWGVYKGNSEFGELLGKWNSHLSRKLVLGVGYTFFACITLGGIASLKKKKKYIYSVGLVFIICIFFLLTTNPPLGFIFQFLQQKVPLFREALRFPFTKFSILLAFTYSIFFGAFFGYIGNILSHKFHRTLLYVLVTCSLLFFMGPAFDGYFISSYMRVDIPKRYFDMFSYFDKESNYGRIANLPIHSMWGWLYYNWNPFNQLGYQGAGFWWFGLKQPIMDREFDRWNTVNEQYYREMSYAIYSENASLVESILNKYKIRWILFDESVIAPDADSKVLFYPETERLLPKISHLSLAKDFGSGLKVYEYKPVTNFSLKEIVSNPTFIEGSLYKEYFDPVYYKFGDYVDNLLSENSTKFPYLGITNSDETVKSDFISSTDDKIEFHIPSQTFSKLVYTSTNEDQIFDLHIQKTASGLNFQLTNTNFVPTFTRSFYISNSQLIPGSILKIGENFVNPEISDYKLKLVFNSIIPIKIFHPDITHLASVTNPSLEVCSALSTDSSYSVQPIADGFILSASKINACATTSLSSLFPNYRLDSRLLRIDTANNNFTEKDICLFNSKAGICQNIFLADGASYLQFSDDSVNYSLRFYVDATLSTNSKSTIFKNIKLIPYNLDSSYNWDLVGDKDLNVYSALSFSKEASLGGAVSTTTTVPRICDHPEQSFDSNKFENVGTAYRYTSNDTAICDSFTFPSAVHSTGYVLELHAKNVTGTPLRICLTNEYSKRCDLNVSLPANNNIQTYFYMIPPMEDGVGYTVSINNPSFGKQPSINELSYVSLTPIPYTLIKSLFLPASSNITHSVLIYNQAYEQGWIALCGYTPCKAVHIRVNNWANGWVFDTNNIPSVNRVTVIFWPQILEYVGFLFLISSITWCLLHSKRETHPDL